MTTSSSASPGPGPSVRPFLWSGIAFGLGVAALSGITPAGTLTRYAGHAAWAAVVFGGMVAVLPRRRLRHLPRWQVVVLAALTIGIAVFAASWTLDRLLGAA